MGTPPGRSIAGDRLKRFGVFNHGLRRLPGLDVLLGCEIVPVIFGTPPTLDGTLGWGRRKYARRARKVAALRGIPFFCLEDGFLRSVELGKLDPPLSLVIDNQGIYYDATAPSQLESLVRTRRGPAQIARAGNLIAAWRSARVSKYNHSRDYAGELPPRYVLVADQTRGDVSIRFGLADEQSFARMLDAALAENPDCTVLLKVHPEVMAGRKNGHFNLESVTANPRIRVLGEDVHPVSVIEKAEAVYVVTSQIGFEGLLWGKRVRTFGMPFYAGWGLTQDDIGAPERRCAVSLADLVHAALVDYPRYIDPETGRHCEPERLIEWMGLQRRMRERFSVEVFALGFSRWKKPIVSDFFQGSAVHFVEQADVVPANATLAVWGRKPVAGKIAGDVRLIRLEDGFLRSVGLGADLVRPLSWVMDERGIYYDATSESGLEHLLQTMRFDPATLERARALRVRIVTEGLTKYNVGGGGWQRPARADRVVLVPGQVESDASIALGAPEIRRNVELLRAVRMANPDARILYKPHPDVVAGLRRRGDGEGDAATWCDEVLIDIPMGELLGQVDEVHVMTSLAGFEALLRGKKVTCYGQPFYAGWGLTNDVVAIPRRTRRLALDELVAATLIAYPTYVSRQTGRFSTPEHALDELLIWRKMAPTTVMTWWRKGLRKVLGWAKG